MTTNTAPAFGSQVLRPGLLVNVKSNIVGNVSYAKKDLEVVANLDADGVAHARWETERTILDAAEHKRATKVRSKARSLVSAVCAKSAFGLLCAEEREDELKAAVAEGHKLAEDFNKVAVVTRVHFFVLSGRVASTDKEAARAVASEVRDLLTEMEQGIEKLDAKAIRAAAGRAKQLGSMLSPAAQARIQIAIDAVRAQARKITAAGETAANTVDRRTLAALKETRAAFLDLEPATEGSTFTPTTVGRGVDLDTAEQRAASAPNRPLELF